MVDSKQLIKEFNESKVGKVLNGKESFRNKIGRVLHGISYKHPKLAMTMGVSASVGAALVGGPVGAVAVSPMMFAGVYSGIVPKKEEKAACDFLMNVAVRKTAAFDNYLVKRGIDEKTRLSAVQAYLKSQAPGFGYFKEYQKDFPSAAQQIMAVGMKGDLPLLHGKELYELEALQEVFTKDRNKDGILKGMIKTFTPAYRERRKEAKKIAESRWADREKWEKMPSDTRSLWRSYMKEQEFLKSKETVIKEEKKETCLDFFKRTSHPLEKPRIEKAYLPVQKPVTTLWFNALKKRQCR